jgi:hypothetical protein
MTLPTNAFFAALYALSVGGLVAAAMLVTELRTVVAIAVVVSLSDVLERRIGWARRGGSRTAVEPCRRTLTMTQALLYGTALLPIAAIFTQQPWWMASSVIVAAASWYVATRLAMHDPA